MADSGPIYQLRLVLTRVSPLIGRRVLVSGDTSLSDLHRLFQILLGWSGEHLYSFRLHGQEYGTACGGGGNGEAEHVRLSHFRLHLCERFTYHYNFFSGWAFDVRLERVLGTDPKKTYPVCTGGCRAAPPEDCGGAQAYLTLLDAHRYALPWEAMTTVAEVLERVLNLPPDRSMREAMGDPQALEQAVERLGRYLEFQPERFDRRTANARLRAFCEGHEVSYEVHVETGMDRG